MSLVETTLQRCAAIKNTRTRSSILKAAMMELGELAQEVAVADGESYKKAGPDGVVGESLDVIATMIDMIYKEKPTLTEADLISMIIPKLDKWETNVNESLIKKDVTCAVVIMHKETLLLAHSTGMNWKHWNFPKGIADEGESHIDAAIRELQEETGLVIAENQLIDLGVFEYLPTKDIHIYFTEVTDAIDARQLVCESMFFCDTKQKNLPECDSFRMVPFHKLPEYLAPKIAEIYQSSLKQSIKQFIEN